ncbi:MAG: hypothetical protein RBT63_04780 [Bdellovibrionales bacterium]|jgi:hypothetical protein|nr:hypothetical protein [Bdellovibrionales bacterium]
MISAELPVIAITVLEMVNRASELSPYACALLIASYKRRSMPEKNLAATDPRFSPELLAAVEKMQERGTAAKKKVIVLDEWVFTKPFTLLPEFPCFDFYLHAFNEWLRFGTYPFAGHLATQPSYAMEVFSLLRALRDEEAAASAKKEKSLV